MAVRIPHEKADALDAARVAVDLELRRYKRRMKEVTDAYIDREHAAAVNELRPFNPHRVAMEAVREARADVAGHQRAVDA